MCVHNRPPEPFVWLMLHGCNEKKKGQRVKDSKRARQEQKDDEMEMTDWMDTVKLSGWWHLVLEQNHIDFPDETGWKKCCSIYSTSTLYRCPDKACAHSTKLHLFISVHQVKAKETNCVSLTSLIPSKAHCLKNRHAWFKGACRGCIETKTHVGAHTLTLSIDQLVNQGPMSIANGHQHSGHCARWPRGQR